MFTIRALKLILLVSLLNIAACSTLEFPGVYVVPIDQGNIVTQDAIDRLKPGMTKEQVEFVLGTPLIRDNFSRDRWDYIYTLRKPREPLQRQRITIFFKNDRINNFISTLLPNPPHKELQDFDDENLNKDLLRQKKEAKRRS